MKRELAELLAIADEAADIVREVYDAPFAVEWKGERDPVTLADTRANELICARLEARFPGVPIVAEESAPERFSGFRDAEHVFFVDPLDGTREFVDRNGEFVVMIGWLVGDAATAGVIVAPESRRAWWGELGEGAFARDEAGTVRSIQVRTTTDLAQAMLVASRSHRGPALERAIEVLGVREVRQLGSAGLKAAAVASGLAEVYAAPGYAGKRWDSCAGDALVRAAGGAASDAFGSPIDYRGERLDNDRGALFTNGALHAPVLEKLRAARSE